METTTDYIPDIEHELAKKSRLMPLVLWGIVGYLAAIGFSVFTDIHTIRKMPAASIAGIVFFIALPVAGLVLLRLKKKAGWVTALLYFGFMTLVCCTFLVQNLARPRHFDFRTFSSWRFASIFLLPSMVTIFLLAADIRKYLGVTKRMLVLSVVTGTLISLGLIIIMMRS